MPATSALALVAGAALVTGAARVPTGRGIGDGGGGGGSGSGGGGGGGGFVAARVAATGAYIFLKPVTGPLWLPSWRLDGRLRKGCADWSWRWSW